MKMREDTSMRNGLKTKRGRFLKRSSEMQEERDLKLLSKMILCLFLNHNKRMGKWGSLLNSYHHKVILKINSNSNSSNHTKLSSSSSCLLQWQVKVALRWLAETPRLQTMIMGDSRVFQISSTILRWDSTSWLTTYLTCPENTDKRGWYTVYF